MDKTQWDTHYKENAALFGNRPNLYFRRFIDAHKPGTILLPAEGEGRNALYAASKGWKVDAFDFSEIAKDKVLKEAAKKNYTINYWLQDLSSFKASKEYDAIALIYVHLPQSLRQLFHTEIYESLKPGGFLVLEAFAKEQIRLDSGGPKDAALLYDAPSICGDFPFLHILSCSQKEIKLDEGGLHKGKAAVLHLVGQRL